MSSRGVLIALSGVDNAGKSTQRELLLDALRARGWSPLKIWTRTGYTPGIERVKRVVRVILRRSKPKRIGISQQSGRYPRRATSLRHPLQRRLWLAVAILDLIRVYAVRVRVLRMLGRAVVCDRYLIDCLVDLRVNFPDDDVESSWLWRTLRRVAARPDAAVCLLVPPDVSAQRARHKGRYHWETEEDLQRRWLGYRELANEWGIEVIDGERPVKEIADSILRTVSAVLPARPAALQTGVRAMHHR